MRFASLGSGSRGNGTLIQTQSTTLLVDCGFSLKDTLRRLHSKGVEPEQLDAIFVTHEHSDHIKGVSKLARELQLPVYLSPGTFYGWSRREKRDWRDCLDIRFIEGAKPVKLGDIKVLPVAVSHDSAEPLQFVFQKRRLKLGLLTDLGCIQDAVIEAYRECQGLILEFNHDLEMLQKGPYPEFLKRRVGGRRGHLSNDQARAGLQRLHTEHLQHLALAHISEKNNHPELALDAVSGVVRSLACHIQIMDQQQGLPWQELHQ